jgi:hypothetical protein
MVPSHCSIDCGYLTVPKYQAERKFLGRSIKEMLEGESGTIIFW